MGKFVIMMMIYVCLHLLNLCESFFLHAAKKEKIFLFEPKKKLQTAIVVGLQHEN